jgi:hypothetical protein
MRDALLWLKRDSMDECEGWLTERIAAERVAAELAREAAKAERAAFLEARQTRCFLFCERCRVSRKSRNLAVGDMVCSSVEPGANIAVVAQLGYLEDLHGPPIPTGVCDLLECDSDRAEFRNGRRDVPLSHLELYPICCGQARCANLRDRPSGYGLDAGEQQQLLDGVRMLKPSCKKRPVSSTRMPVPAAKVARTSQSRYLTVCMKTASATWRMRQSAMTLYPLTCLTMSMTASMV